MSNNYSILGLCLVLGLCCVLVSCAYDQESQHHVPFDSIKASCIISEDDRFIITGTAKDTFSAQPKIKSPFIMSFDNTLVKLSQHYFPTTTTSVNPSIIQTAPTEYMLTYYRAKSLKDQTEISQLLYLDDAFNTTKEMSYGNRTRIKNLLSLKNDSVITLNYERSTQHTSIQLIQNKKLLDHVSYAVSDETNIPTAIISIDQKAFVIAGIANGFHHPDGHDFKNSKAYGYIIRIDENGRELNQYKHIGGGHVFFHDLVQYENFIHIVGTQQSDGTGMDQLIIVLDSGFNFLSKSIVQENGIQEWLLAKKRDTQLFLAGVSENLDDHTMKLRLQSNDQNHQVRWENTITEPGSYKPIDMTITKTHLILLVEKTTTRTAPPESYIYQFSLDGTLNQKIKIN